MPEMTDAYEWHGRTVVGSDGEKIGTISEVYVDAETGKPEWATVSSGLFGTKSNFVPLAGASPQGEDVRATATKEQVKDAPGVENDGEVFNTFPLLAGYDVQDVRIEDLTADGSREGSGILDGCQTGAIYFFHSQRMSSRLTKFV